MENGKYYIDKMYINSLNSCINLFILLSGGGKFNYKGEKIGFWKDIDIYEFDRYLIMT